MRLKDKVVVVTGAGRNIGEAIARLAADEGASVAALDLDDRQAERVAGDLDQRRPGSALGIGCDVSDATQVREAMGKVVGSFGRLDVLVNNVAITDRKPLLELEEEEWDMVMAVSLKSVFLCSKHAAACMVETGNGGVIVNLGSTSGHRGRANATAYTAAKAGVLNLTRTMAVQLAPYRVRVNSVTPNMVGSPVGEATERPPGTVKNLVGRNGVPLDVANAVVFLASEEASFITGAELLVDGGVLASLH